MRARSFRNEDYNKRRVFLRSYPLDWGETDDESKDEGQTHRITRDRGKTERITKDKGNTERINRDKGKTEGITKECDEKRPISKKVIAVLKWGGGKILILRRFRHNIVVYVVTCLPIRFKAPTALISAKCIFPPSP